MLGNILLAGYITIALIVIIFISIAIPRIAKLDNNKPTYIYIGFYIINSLILNYILRLHPIKTLVTNLVLLVLAQIIGVRLRLFGLTGQICAGKSTTGQYLHQKYNATVIELDQLYSDVLLMPETRKEIRFAFGDEVFSQENAEIVNQALIRRITYSDAEKRRKFEMITHTKLWKALLWILIQEKLLKHTKYVFLDNSLLLRFPFLTLFCFPIIAICTNSNADILARVMERESCDRSTAELLVSKEMKMEEFLLKSDFVIFNDYTVEELKLEVDKFMSKTFG